MYMCIPHTHAWLMLMYKSIPHTRACMMLMKARRVSNSLKRVTESCEPPCGLLGKELLSSA